jgi:putative ABC transport system ATP-binding protein
MTDTGATEPRTTIRVAKLNHFFGEGESRNQVLFDNDIEIEAGQLVIMTGPSGSGKTTLLTLIGALRSIQSGRIEILGNDLSGLQGNPLVAMRRNIGFIFQMHNLFDSLSASENVKMAMQLGSCAPSEMRRRGTEILDRLGLSHRIDHKPKTLSGGQRQRVAVARALVNRPKLILADEPTAALDKDSSRIVVNLLKELTTQEGGMHRRDGHPRQPHSGAGRPHREYGRRHHQVGRRVAGRREDLRIPADRGAVQASHAD